MPSLPYPLLRAYYTRRALPNRLTHHIDRIVGRDTALSLKAPLLGVRTRLQVNPANITKTIAKEQRRFALNRLFRAGDWDLGLTSGDIRERMKYRTIAEILDGVPVEETTEYKSYQKKLAQCTAKGIELQGPAALPRDKLIEYMDGLASMYRSVVRDGAFDPSLMLKSPIKAGITRKGEIVKLSDGNHRLALAHYARISCMPIEIRVIHTDNLAKITDTGDLLDDLNRYLEEVEEQHQG